MSLPKIRLEKCELHSQGVWILDDEQARHLTKALRMYEGALVEGLRADGACGEPAGGKFLLRLERDEGVYLLREIELVPQKTDKLSITLLIGLLKADQFENVLRASAELGVASIRPIACERSIPRFEAGGLERKMPRWRRIIDEGSKVSGTITPPALFAPVRLSAVEWDALPQKRYAAMLSKDALPLRECYTPETEGCNEVAFAVGPEGDWSDAETRFLLDGGFVPISMGERVLRASTAALVGCGWFCLSQHSTEGKPGH